MRDYQRPVIGEGPHPIYERAQASPRMSVLDEKLNLGAEPLGVVLGFDLIGPA